MNKSDFIHEVNKSIDKGDPSMRYETTYLEGILGISPSIAEQDKIQRIKDIAEENGWKTAFWDYETICSFKENDVESVD